MDEVKLRKTFEKFKYPLLILAIGVMLMLLPGSQSKNIGTSDSDANLSSILANTQGVGKAQVLVSDKGVVVLCQGADNAKVRLDIIQAIGSYTGYSSDKITVLKMAK